MIRRPFYRWKSFWLGVSVVVMLVGALVLLPGRGAMNARRRAQSPDGELTAFALPFAGPGPESDQGGLVVYLSSSRGSVIDKHRTSLQGTRQTRLEWIPSALPRSFRIWDEQGTRMIWRVEGERVVCVEGREFLLPVPNNGEK